MICALCHKPVILVPSAAERAQKLGGTAQSYTRLFPTHSECQLAKNKADAVALMRRLSAK